MTLLYRPDVNTSAFSASTPDTATELMLQRLQSNTAQGLRPDFLDSDLRLKTFDRCDIVRLQCSVLYM